MPVTKTAKRALRGSVRKGSINTIITTELEKAIRIAKKSKKLSDVIHAMSLADRAAKKQVFHRNKAARIKSALSKLAAPAKPAAKAKPAKKTTKSSKK